MRLGEILSELLGEMGGILSEMRVREARIRGWTGVGPGVRELIASGSDG